jgi:hypothetical protein
MAIINNLALSMGGGIISLKQQAKQAENTVSILIGLGGTGVDCIREIKTQVYSRIEPDGGEDATVARYRHIRFLGVDADNANVSQDANPEDKKTAETLSLSESEAFTLAGKGITLKVVKQARDVYTQYAWVSDKIEQSVMEGSGAGGVRQVGRFLLMTKADDFMTKLQNLISDAKIGLQSPEVVVHIFSGMGGGTGSGTFLDVCYMVREVIKNEPKAYVCGYFFMPDVNVAHVRSNNVKQYIPLNGYAAMQELDYCMNIEKNHGKFRQEYTGGKLIDWDRAPVNYCHLISALDNNGNVRQDAYNYAMKVTSEYVFEFLVKTVDSDNFGMKSHLSNAETICGQSEKNKKYGYFINYLSIGASSAVVPLKEINTYLATRLFDRFSEVGRDIPDESDVWNFTVGVFGEDKSDKDIQSRVYDALYANLQGDSKEAYKQWDGNASQMEKNGDQEMVYFYEGQTAEKEGILAKNKERLLDAKNRDSLISRVKKIMYTVITDINRGPVFGFNILNGANKFSIDNVISGLITTNTEKLNNLRKYTKGKEDMRNDAKNGWDHRKIYNKNDRCKTYVNKVYDIEQQRYLEKSYMYMDELLNSVRLQIRKISTEYYSVLSQIYKNLRETFKDNSSVLAKGIIVDEVKGFEKSLIDINDPNMQQALVGELRKVSPNIVFRQLIEALLDDEKSWKSDAKIARTVTGFFVGEKKDNKEPGIFHDFADKTIENFLEIVYDTDDKDKIAEKIKNGWLSDLYSSAAPLFYKDNKVYTGEIATSCRMSVPIGALSLKKAADEYISEKDIKLAQTGTKDRIFFLTSGMAFPISAHMGISEVERQYYETPQIGKHYYEGLENADIEFSDWRNLPFLMPMYLVEKEKNRLYKIAEERCNRNLEIYSGIEKYNLIKEGDNNEVILLKVSDSYDEKISILKAEVENYIADKKLSATAMREKRDELLASVCGLKKDKSSEEYYVDTEYSFTVAGNTKTPIDFNRLLRDMICYSPVMLMEAEKSIKKLENGNKTLTELEEKIKSVDATLSKLADKEKVIFFNALFTGVIKLGKSTGEFTPIDEDGIEDETICLSKMDDEFEYNDILPYQVYKTFITLDSKTKNIMKEMSNKVINGSDEKVAEIVTELTKTFSNKNYKVWLSDANDNHTGDKEEIKEFLKETMRRFKTQCMKYDIEVEQ